MAYVYHLIREADGYVENTVEAAPAWPAPEGYIKRLRSQGGKIGDTWDGEKFVSPPEPPEPAYRRIVMRRVIVDRLAAAGLLDAAMAALDQAGTYTRERWYALRDGPFVDDPDTLNLLAAIGADPEVILAPHEEDILVPVEPEPA